MERKLAKLALTTLFALTLGISSLALAQMPPAPDCYPGETCAVPAAPAKLAAVLQTVTAQPRIAVELISAMEMVATPEQAVPAIQESSYPHHAVTPVAPRQVEQWALWSAKEFLIRTALPVIATLPPENRTRPV